jgi:outer membrane protein OmpA-like peptidoglycan-associated protein
MPASRTPVLHRLVAGGALVLAVALAPVAAEAQGIGFSLTPSLEEARWGDDLLVTNTIFPGALLSAHFGRFVSLDTHYFRSGALEVEGSATDMIASRWGGDVRFVLSPTPLAPFIRLGAGVVEFKPDADDGAPSRHLSTSLGGGLRFDLRDRVGGELSVRRLSFRAGPGSGVVADDGSPEPQREISAYTLGLGVQVPLGGTWNDPETDEAIRNLRTVTVPVRLFAGSLDFSDALGLDSHTVMGALVGADLGPFVGASLYAFGSARDGLGSPEQLYGYGLEGSFNLVRRGASATPHLLLGGGRLHFTEEDRVAAALDERVKWTATVGAGVDFRVTDRFRGEISARNLVMSQSATADVSDPDQLRSSWLYSGGIRFVVGGGRRGSDQGARSAAPERSTERASTERAEREPGEEESRPRTTSEDVDALSLERDRLIRELEVERLRQALDQLRNERDPAAAERLLAEYRGDAPTPPTPRSFEVPVLEQGEIRVRFGPEGARDSTVAATPAPAQSQAQPPPAAEAPRDPRVDRLLESVGRLEGRLEELLQAPAAQPTPQQPVDVRVTGAGGVPGETTVVTGDPAPRGVLRGEAPGLKGFGFFTGARLSPVDQALLGVELDVGSAFGGGIRLRPDITLGLTNGFTWGVDAHLQWPAPVELWSLRPRARRRSRDLPRRRDHTRHDPQRHRGSGTRHHGTPRGLPHPEVTRFLRRPPAGRGRPAAAGPRAGRADACRRPAPGRRRGPAARSGRTSRSDPRPRSRARTHRAPKRTRRAARRDERPQERAHDRRRGRPRSRTPGRGSAGQAAAERDTVAEPAPEPDLLDRLRELERLESVQSVRRVARGVAIVLGGGDTFAVGQDQLSPLAHSEIRTIADLLVDGGASVSVEGHTDSTGGAALNQQLSTARAEAVRAALLAHGVASSRASAVGFGLTRPVADNATPEGRAANRRVEIIVLTGGGTGGADPASH